MYKNKKIKFSLLFIVSMSLAFVLLAIFLSIFFIDGIKNFGNFTVKTNERNIKEYAGYLLQKNIESTSQYYSAVFERIAVNSELIASKAGNDYDEAKLKKEILGKYSNFRFKKSRNGIYYNNFTLSDFAIFVTDNKYGSQKANKSFSNNEKTALYLFLKLKDLVRKSAEKTPYMHGFWITFTFDRFYTGLYPNVLKSLDSNSSWGWEQGEKLVNKFTNPSFFKEKNKTIWSSIHYSMTREPLISVVSPIYSKTDGYIGVVGTTLYVKAVMDSIVGDSITPKYEYGILDKGKEYEKYEGAFSFILNANGNLIAFPKDKRDLFDLPHFNLQESENFNQISLAQSKNIKIKELVKLIMKQVSGTKTVLLNGSSYIFSYCKLNTGWSLCTVLPEDTVTSSVRKSNTLVKVTANIMSKDIIIVTFILLCLSIILSLYFFSKYLFKPIKDLTERIKLIGKGNFCVEINKNETAEINDLAQTFNYLCKELKEYEINLENEIKQRLLIETEVKVAGNIQLSLLPKITDDFIRDDFLLGAILSSAKDASGDFYDFFYVEENKIAMLIADVSGKGISAALFMAVAITLIKSICLQFHEHNPDEVLTVANNILSRDNKKLMFVTGILGFYEIDTGEFTFSNAGHHEALRLTADNKCLPFSFSKEMAMGIMPDIKYSIDKIKVKHGEKIIFYTDGVIEAVDSENNEYGTARLKQIIQKNTKMDCKLMAESIANDVIEFEKGNRFDDITILIFERIK